MIKRKRIRKYLSKQLDGIHHNLGEMKNNIDEDKLHELRLYSKKAKAITAFLQESLHEKKKYSIKKLKKLFHYAGNIRTAQMNLETIKDNDIRNEAFEKDQQAIIDADTKKLSNKTQKYDTHISTLAKRLYENLKGVKNKTVIVFYYTNIKLLSNNLHVIDEARLHENRKTIKKLLYNLKLLPAPIAERIRINKDYLDNLQDLIGKWHDSVVTLDQLTKTGMADKKSLAQLQKNKQCLLEKVTNEAKDFDNKVLFAKRPGALRCL